MGKELVLAHVLCRGRRTSRFYVFDLEANKVLETPVAVSHQSGDAGIVRLGSRIYVVGGRGRLDDDDDDADDDYDDDDDEDEDEDEDSDDQYIHSGRGTSYFDLPKLPHLLSIHNNTCHSIDNPVKFMPPSHNTWKQLHPPAASSHPILSYHPACASLGGKIYAFTFSSHCIGDVFNPQSQQWKCLPPLDIPKGCFGMSSLVFPDEKNDRLLVHFGGAPVLCAYYPATTNWEECRLDPPNFWPRIHTSALVDGVLYSLVQNSDFFLAYDVTTKSRLKVVHSSPFPLPYRVSDFLQMIHLGDGMLCLTNYAHLYIHEAGLSTTRVQFAKFRVKRANLKEVHVAHVAFNSFSFENPLSVSDCLAL